MRQDPLYRLAVSPLKELMVVTRKHKGSVPSRGSATVGINDVIAITTVTHKNGGRCDWYLLD